MKSSRTISRRDFVYLAVGGGGLVVAGYPLSRVFSQPTTEGGELFKPTPTNTLGPYYKPGAPVTEKLSKPNTLGKPLIVSGRIIDTRGKLLTDAKLEVFHADAHGDYDLDGFNYRGVIPVSTSGTYKYETVVPGEYGGRAQHVHYMINAPGHKRLITQLYFENDPKFGGDPNRNYTRDGLVEHRELIRPVSSVKRNNVEYSTVEFNLCLEPV